MFYISKDYGDNSYGVTNTNSNNEQRLSLEELLLLPNKVIGVSRKLRKVTRVFSSIEDIYKTGVAKLRLSNTKLYEACTFDCDGKDIYLSSVDRGVEDFKIPDFVTKLGDKCFINCISLESIRIPDSVVNLGNSCFYGCTFLEHIEIPNSVTEIERYCFCSCKSVQSIRIPDSVKEIPEYCFANCTSLQNINIPNSVTKLDTECFVNCSALQSIDIPNSVNEICERCFNGCTSLQSIRIPSSVRYIGRGCFTRCLKVTVIVDEGSYSHKHCETNGIRYIIR